MRTPLVLITATQLACGGAVSFVEPTPPQLRFDVLTVEHRAADEPVILGLIFDLEIPDPVECRSTQQMLLDFAQARVDEQGGAGRVLGPYEVSPGCAQAPERALAMDSLTADVAAAREQFGHAHVRPLFLYANNVDWPLPGGLQQDLASLAAFGPSSERPAVSFALTTPQVVIGATETVAWTFAADPRLKAALETVTRRYLPFRSRSAMPERALFEQLPEVKAFRWCNPRDWLQPVGFPPDRTATASPADPPRLRSLMPDLYMARAEEVATRVTEVQLEVCTGHCERFAETPEGLRRWDSLTGCLHTAEEAQRQ